MSDSGIGVDRLAHARALGLNYGLAVDVDQAEHVPPDK